MTTDVITTPKAPLTTGARGSNGTGHRPGEKSFGAGRVIAFAILIVLAIAWLLPFAWAIVTSLKSETDAASSASWIPENGFTLGAYSQVLAEGNIPLWTVNSILTAVVITALTVATGALAAYALSRLDFAGRRTWYIAIVAAIIVPPQVLIIPLFYQALAFNTVDTYLGLILPQVVAPAMVFILAKFFDQVPIELEEAARVDGASRLRVFWSIVLPLSRPILAAVSIFVFISAWNNFLWPFLVVNDTSLMTLPVGLQTVKSAFGVQYAQNMASAILAALPLIIVFLFFQRQIIKGISTTGLGGT
ncbi:MAG: sugar transporter permease [Microbacteriaceae bacterium]|jgi:multiple sugar transport system permease protein|nr:sugar transporter permease [Microbacteriaceae bacterium]